MNGYVLDLDTIDRTRVASAGGKGANLGELTRIDGIRVPAGFCLTTDAHRRALAGNHRLGDLIDRLSRLNPDDRDAMTALSARIRHDIATTRVPDDVVTAITDALARFGETAGYAVRSSATAEDGPNASFAGQQDSYLDVTGPEAIVEHVGRCWASLFTDRAVAYRLRNGFDHRQVSMAVVVQHMVPARAAGVAFTADPVTGHRGTTSVEATVGLGDALVSGLVNTDGYTVRDGAIVTTTVAGRAPALTDAQVERLTRLCRRIEAHFGCPQDIEWCLADDEFHIVQARPITTLFPIPDVDDDANHVYVSVGHQQMMTDPMKPLGLSFWQLITPRRMAEAAGRLFVDVTAILAAPDSRATLIETFTASDPLMGNALRNVVDRDGFLPPPGDSPAWKPLGAGSARLETDPAITADLIDTTRVLIADAEREMRTTTGPALFDFILTDIQEMKRVQFDPRSMQAVMAGIEATGWLNDRLKDWLGEKNPADTLTLSAPNNITSQMGLALLDVADVIREHPPVVAFLREAGDDFLDRLPDIDGGTPARDAIRGYLTEYGMRCVGEIDITRPRWIERPAALLPMLLANVDNFAPGAGVRRFEQGRQEAKRKELDLLERLRALPDGESKAAETKRMIDRVRTFIGYREYPKYAMISRYFVYKQGLLREIERLVHDGVLRDIDDGYFLTFDELHEVARGGRFDQDLVDERKAAYATYETLTPPRVLTSDGEAVASTYGRDDLPDGSLVGLAVSAGTVEGRARVILDMAQADPRPGDILVTTHTDPSWSPLFVAIAGLVTEVGGLMTHGAVVAREYGLPAVVGVEHATSLIRDGQRIRVNGTDGHVEILT